MIDQQYKEIQPPRFIKPLQPQYFGENEVALLEAIVESEPLSSFQWFVHNEPIKSSTECRIVTKANKSTLLIANFEKKYTGPYTCRAENVGGSVTSTATVHLLEDAPQEEAEVFESPRFVEELIAPVEVMDGEPLELNCKVVGKPIPKVEWYHNNEKIVENKETLIVQDAEGHCQLQITEVFPENDGEYKCVATNKIGETVTKTTVNIQGTFIQIQCSGQQKSQNIHKNLDFYVLQNALYHYYYQVTHSHYTKNCNTTIETKQY